MTNLVIFSDDFRVKDNASLYEACKDNQKVILLYVYDEKYLGRTLGIGFKSFLHCTLKSFSKMLEHKYNAKLIIKKGKLTNIIDDFVKEHNVQDIYKSKSYTEHEIDVENILIKNFGHRVKLFQGKLLFHPTDIKTGEGNFFRVYTPFYKACIANAKKIGETLPEPEKIISINNIDSLKVEDLGLENEMTQKISEAYEFDYEQVIQNAQYFLKNKVQNYTDNRNIPSKNSTSGFSPYFRVGILSPRMIYNACAFYQNTIKFISEIMWREFAYHVGFFHKDIHKNTFKKNYDHFEFENNIEYFKAWKNAETGFLFVDAGMKELVQTGNMHNRLRMVVASCLIKDLLVDWRWGEEFFWEYLVDADPMVNPFSWQWVFGSGFDAAPYFRIFNPDLQLERFDPERIYCKKWLGEALPSIKPIVDHKKQKDVTLARYKIVAVINV